MLDALQLTPQAFDQELLFTTLCFTNSQHAMKQNALHTNQCTHILCVFHVNFQDSSPIGLLQVPDSFIAESEFLCYVQSEYYDTSHAGVILH